MYLWGICVHKWRVSLCNTVSLDLFFLCFILHMWLFGLHVCLCPMSLVLMKARRGHWVLGIIELLYSLIPQSNAKFYYMGQRNDCLLGDTVV